jgi:hypothetical protein
VKRGLENDHQILLGLDGARIQRPSFLQQFVCIKTLVRVRTQFSLFHCCNSINNLNFEICLFKHNLGRMTNNSPFLLTRSVSIFFEEEMLSVYRARLSRFVSFTCNHGVKSLCRLGKFKCKTSKISITSCLPLS